MASPIYTRAYSLSASFEYKNQLNIWCDRVGIGHIRFVTDPSDHRDAHGHQLYQAIPIFPELVDLGARSMAQGRTQEEAYRTSLSMVPWAQYPTLRAETIHYGFEQYPDGSILAKPCLVTYGRHINLTRAVGYGTSRSKAEDAAAEILLRQYCFFN